MAAEDACLRENVRLLFEGADLLHRVGDARYTSPEPGRPSSSIGFQLRHCIDFYAAFLRGAPRGRVDYEQRDRDPRVPEDRAYAAARLRDIAHALSALQLDPDAPLDVHAELGEDGGWCRSTLARELQFLLSHTVHHYALVALMLRARGYEPGHDFGVAGSTLRHWNAVRT